MSLTASSLPAVKPAPLLFARHARVLFQGDSITDGGRGRGADPNHILGHGYAFIVAARNGAANPGQEWTFLNRGVSGNKVTDLEVRWQADTLDLMPDVLSILIGINDLSTGVTAADYEAQYDALLLRTRNALPKVTLILCEPFALPAGDLLKTWDTFGHELAARAATVRKLAERYSATFLPLQKVFDEATRRAPAEYWMWDGVHPTHSGHHVLADAWEQAVMKASAEG